MTKSIVIAERDNIAAILEDDKVMEFFVNRGDVLLGDVYLAKVDNILPSIDAAFVDVGYDKMGFLHTEDIIGKGSLKDKVKPNQTICVQVVKEPTGHKGPRVTMNISLPGRFLVLIPQETGINVSRKITSAKERARLKSVVSLIKPVGVGVIVRTEAEGQSEADIQDDLEMLLEKWNTIITAAESHTAPCIIHRDQDLLYRVIREACSEDVTNITVDTAFAHQRVSQLLNAWNMNKNITVETYKGTQPLLVATGLNKEIKAALQVKVNLPSGGYLFVQTTEALTVIDVNSGKFTSSATQDETIVKTNIEAVHEIARQLKLRNIGGMIIVDFIDMNTRTNKLAVMQELELALEEDKAKPQVGQLSDLGLVELTRHRQGQSLSELFTKKCPHCQGTGQFIDDLTFSSSVAEGEYRAKAAKVKLPNNNQKQKNKNEKFNNNKNFNKNHEQKATDNKKAENIVEDEIEEIIATTQDNVAQLENQAEIINNVDETENNKKGKKSSKNRLPRAQKKREKNMQVESTKESVNDIVDEPMPQPVAIKEEIKTELKETKEQIVTDEPAKEEKPKRKRATSSSKDKTDKPAKPRTRRARKTKDSDNAEKATQE